MSKRVFILGFLLLAQAVGLTATPAMAAKREQSPCDKPPDLVSTRPLSKEEQEKAKRIRAQGSVAIEISENGDVADAKVIRASSEEAGKLLIERAKGMKFRSRTGCGPFKTTINFNLSGLN